MEKILLIEDDLSLIDGLSYSIKKQGFELEIARTVKEAYGLYSDGKLSKRPTQNGFAWIWLWGLAIVFQTKKV